jgi:hypothetical protein
MPAEPKQAINDGDLAAGAKQLQEAKGGSKDVEADLLDYDRDVAAAMASLYNKYDGDVDRIFDEAGENTYKVKKYPPSSAEEFGRKYAQGFYEVLEGSQAGKK